MVDGRPTNYQNGNHSSIPLEVLVNNLLTECSLNRSDISTLGSLANGMNKILEARVHTSAKQNVIVTTVIDENCQSAPFLVEDLFAENSANHFNQVKIFAKDKMLECSSPNWTWIRSIRLAEDCQSYNLELRSHLSKSTFALTTTRKIQPSESPVLWFSQEVLMSLRVPHLSLTNIQGEKKYICHRCPFQCEMPNPLKIHLALECGTLTKEDLWQRLKPLRIKSPLPLPTSPLNFSITSNPLSPTPLVVLPTAELMSARTTSISAFKPYQKPVSKIGYEKPTKMRVDGMAKIYSMLPPPPLPTLHPPNEVSCEERKTSSGNHSLVTIDEATILYKRAVEMETIASNLGKFKQGHLCIYCGKVYSRKYGLKIHIRTHTGFKPLKCKYCFRPFGDPSNLNKHVRLHSEGDAPYKCDQCGKILVRKRDLDRHIKSRH